MPVSRSRTATGLRSCVARQIDIALRVMAAVRSRRAAV
jgi:hypothetical protein